MSFSLVRNDRYERSACEPDATYRTLLGELAWRRLPAAVRTRFSVKPAPGSEIRYRGVMHVVRLSLAGRVFTRLGKLVGEPLAPHAGSEVPVVVTLRAAPGGGIVWERLYRFPGRAPVFAISVKRATARDGLIECVGGGGMWLRLTARRTGLSFESRGYFWRIGRLAVPIPGWLTPGRIEVLHEDLGVGKFRFRIEIRHPWLGETFFQDGTFAEAS